MNIVPISPPSAIERLSVLVELAGATIIVDAGLTWQESAWLLSRLEEQGTQLDGIVVSHAHPGQMSGLLHLHKERPGLPLFVSEATWHCMARLALDESENMPVEERQAWERALGACQVLPWGMQHELLAERVHLSLLPAGHVFGASMVSLVSVEGSVLITGEGTLRDQSTSTAMVLPPRRPDAVVVSAMYGGGLYASRAAEELRLLAQATDVLERGGRLVFPLLPLGRLQELALLFQQAQAQGKLPPVPVFIDAKGTSICRMMAQYPGALPAAMRRRVRKYGHLFASQGPSPIPFSSVEAWKEAQAQESAIVLVGRLSSIQAQFEADIAPFLCRAEDALMLSGYKDEEAPEHYGLCHSLEDGLSLGGKALSLACDVRSYRLSLHADTVQLASFVEKMKPRGVVVLQGSERKREAIRQALSQLGVGSVHLPEQFAEVSIKGTARSLLSLGSGATTQTREGLQFTDLVELRDIVCAQDAPDAALSAQELLLLWGDEQGADDPAEVERVSRFLGAKQSPFKRERKRQHLFRLRELPKTKDSDAETASRKASDGPFDAFRALQEVDAHLTIEHGLYKRSSHKEQLLIKLSFHFPKVARERYREVFAQISSRTGWQVELRESPHHEALVEAAMDALPDGVVHRKRPALHLGDEKLVLQLEEALAEDVFSASAAQFLEQTGFRLELKGGAASGEVQRALGEVSVPDGGAAVAPWEVNRAYQCIREAFRASPHELLKVGQRGNVLEVSFMTPQIGARYHAELAQLSERVGWSIEVRDRVDQHRLKELARSMIPEGWGRKKEPSVHAESAEVRVTCQVCPTGEEREALSAAFEEQTGFALRFKAAL